MFAKILTHTSIDLKKSEFLGQMYNFQGITSARKKGLEFKACQVRALKGLEKSFLKLGVVITVIQFLFFNSFTDLVFRAEMSKFIRFLFFIVGFLFNKTTNFVILQQISTRKFRYNATCKT